ncbi:Leo1-like protein-domain-containing protein [Macrophomina phaseolina]|uniref:Leo1-like protein-domain-containing protein n=1 Tax=Macrophomina phaseolina TaxID=35725 RepID=A0ABQ8GA04_9PEZI|nr:Leo1-like protein-domain-containing protein [Macrophomina phaseolina]
MASDSETNLPDPFGDDGEATDAIAATNSPPADQNDDDDEDDVVTGRRTTSAGGAAASDEELNDDEPPLDDDDDLFGDGGDDDEEVEQAPAERTLDDEELDSGDDMERHDRVRSAAAEDVEAMELQMAEASLPRHPVPEPSDNELYLMKVPRFLAIDPKNFVLEKWQPPTTDHHSKTEPSSTFSPFKTAQTTLRWRHSPSDPSKLQSNARILRWSDGSLTLQLGSDPTQQYELDGKPLAPPQINPLKPTPTSIKDNRKTGPQLYDPSKDSFTYLCTPHQREQLVRVTNKVTAGLSILPSKSTTDDSLERLQESLAAAAKARSGAGGAVAIVSMTDDPEKKKKEAEAAERERERLAKIEERAKERQRAKDTRGFGRSGFGRSAGYGGFRSGAYENEERGARGPKQRRHRQEDYSDEEEDAGPRARFREDEYDEEDDFIAGSEEEPQTYEDDEDIDEQLEAQQRRERRSSPKRAHRDDDDDEDDDEEVIAASSRKRRRVVDDEDEDED